MIDEMRIVVQLAIGLVLLQSSSVKLLNPVGFAKGVREYQILPASLAYLVGLLLIPLELFLAVSHLTGWLLAFAVPIGVAMLASFVAAVAINLKREVVLPCYCFGAQGDETISKRTLARLFLMIGGELLLIADPSLFSTSKLIYPTRITNLSELALVLFWSMFLLVAGLWLLSVTDLIALLRKCVTCGGQAKANSSSDTS